MTTTLRPRRPPARPRSSARPRTRPPARMAPTALTARMSKRRLTALLVVLLFAFSAIVARLVYIQGIDSAHYVAYGESQRVRTIALPAARGSISDRNGFDLAISVPRPTIWANPHL